MIAVRFTGAILGNVLMWSGTVLYTIYAPGERHWGISPLADQSTAGVIMMVEGTFLALGVLAWVFFEAAREGIEKQRLLDLAQDHGVALDERAGAAGGRRRPGGAAGGADPRPASRRRREAEQGVAALIGRGPGSSPARSGGGSPSRSTSPSRCAPALAAAAVDRELTRHG